MQLEEKNLGASLGTRITARLRRLKWPLIIILLLAATGGYFGYRYTVGKSKPSYLTVTVGKGNIADVIQANGIIEPVRTVGLNFKSSGLIKAIYVQPGDRVKAGQVLAEQDTAELEAQVKQSESNLKRSEAQLKLKEAGSLPQEIAQKEAEVEANRVAYEMAVKELERQQKLFEAGAAPATDVDKAKEAVASAKSRLEQSQQALNLLKQGSRPEDIEAARATVEADRAQLEIARLNLENARLRAPFDGIVAKVNGEVGQRGGAGGSNENTAFITLVSEELQLRAWVNEADIGKVKLNQDVEFTVAAYPNVTFKGKVKNISPQATTQSNVQIFEVLISVEDPSKQLRPGMTATASIVLAKKSDVLAVPNMALSFAESYLKSQAPAREGGTRQAGGTGRQAGGGTGGQGSQGGQRQGGARREETVNDNTKVVLVLENDQPVPKRIKVGLSDGQYVEVLEGLKEGDKVVIGMVTGRQSQQSTSSSGQTQRSGPQRSPGFPGGPMPLGVPQR